MTVLPGSLDYLYHNGILDHIPYEAYEGAITSVAKNNSYNSQKTASETKNELINNSGINISKMYNSKGVLQYEDSFKRLGYDSVNIETSKDSFSRESKLQAETSSLRNSGQNLNSVNEGQDSFRKSIVDEGGKSNPRNPEKSLYIKGLVGAVILLGTLVCLIKGKKPAGGGNVNATSSSFWLKLNPLKWFKK